jgi:atypical dual specificity phosphatase
MPSPSSTLSELTFHRFGVAFGQRVVLAEMELHLAPRGIDVLMGPVKTGKSTLFRTLAGLYQGHALHRTWGLASLDGVALDDGNRPALVQQQVRLLDQTVLQVLRQAIPSADAVRSPAAWREWAAQLLTEHGQAAWAARLDAPLMDCPLHMQRTLLILSQVAARPRLLMIDEPTAGLSEPDAHTMIQWLRTLGQQCKLLVSLHNQRQARALADAIVLMGGGRVLAYQPVEEFFSRPANELVQQFVQTGSLSLPSPDARPDDLEAGTPLPPPLPNPTRTLSGSTVK